MITDQQPAANRSGSHGRSTFDIDKASDFQLEAWQDAVFVGAHGEGLVGSAPTPELMAETLLSLLEHHRSSTDFTPPTGVTCPMMPLSEFIQPWHNLRM
jgi:hypothetical protein